MILSVAKKIEYGSRVCIPYHNFLTNAKEMMEEIIQIHPAVIEAFPSILVEIAQVAIKFSQFKNFKVKYAITFGENMKLDQRKFIEKNLGCEVIDRYGLEEFGAIGTECRYHNGFHLNVESFVLEIVDDNGFPVPLGKRGRIIITDLRNYAMPFVRYDTGDKGYFFTAPCSCGLENKQFMVEGRIGEFFLIGEKKIHYVEFERIFESLSGAIVQYQVAKDDEDIVTLFIIRGPAMTELILEHIREKIQSLIGIGHHLNIEFVNEIKRTTRGKCQTLIS
ncbi:MAG: hypothetical protein Q8P56_06260 [Candidatus Uhrbacteria bacterium]|nr:hypothetical protein [Candidatus Uhrbacteria bacterium]